MGRPQVLPFRGEQPHSDGALQRAKGAGPIEVVIPPSSGSPSSWISLKGDEQERSRTAARRRGSLEPRGFLGVLAGDPANDAAQPRTGYETRAQSA